MSKLRSRQIALILMVVIGCVSIPNLYAFTGDTKFNYNRMSFGCSVSSRILPLESLGGNLSSSQNFNIMKNGFLTSGAESYGYFKVTLSYRESYGGGPREDQTLAAWYIVGAVTGGIGLFFLPMGQDQFTLSALLEFFDCNKNQIASYKSSAILDAYRKSVGDTDHTWKAQPLYRDLLKQCQTNAAKDADKINADLVNAKYPPPPPAPPIETVVKDTFDNLSGKIPSDARIAVIGANQDADVTLGTRQIEQQFVDSKKVHVLDRIITDKCISEIIFSRSVFVSEAIEAGKMLSATHIVYVEIAGEGTNRKLNTRVLSVRTGEVIASFSSLFS